MNHATFPLSVKKLSEAGQLEGLAAGYGNIDSHGEIFAPGAFAKAIAGIGNGRSPAMLLHHDHRRPAGRWDTFAETRDGLTAKGALALDAVDGREAYALLKAGALTGLSVGFRPVKSTQGAGGTTIITEAELYEVSLVSVPSNPATKISDVKAVANVRELEVHLRELGLSGRRAKAAAAAAFRAADETNDEQEVAATAVRLTASTRAIAALMEI
ncbi:MULTISPECIES: HK97 family phage prohead protease [unclassified Sphingomonas]|uniref:HK97 family phage prohead protease n=1 Tax=Sphingomonas sp. PvP015 TaxID=3156388 RepID=UPI0033965305